MRLSVNGLRDSGSHEPGGTRFGCWEERLRNRGDHLGSTIWGQRFEVGQGRGARIQRVQRFNGLRSPEFRRSESPDRGKPSEVNRPWPGRSRRFRAGGGRPVFRSGYHAHSDEFEPGCRPEDGQIGLGTGRRPRFREGLGFSRLACLDHPAEATGVLSIKGLGDTLKHIRFDGIGNHHPGPCHCLNDQPMRADRTDQREDHREFAETTQHPFRGSTGRRAQSTHRDVANRRTHPTGYR